MGLLLVPQMQNALASLRSLVLTGGGEGGVGKRVCLVACPWLAWPLLVEVVAQDLRARWVAQLGHGLGLDLADALAGDAVDLTDFV